MTYAGSRLALLTSHNTSGRSAGLVSGAMGYALLKSPTIRFGLDLFCLINWPSVAYVVINADRRKATPSAKLLEVQDRLAVWLQLHVGGRRYHRLARSTLARIHKDPTFWWRVAGAVLDEAINPNICSQCGGSGEIWVTRNEDGFRVTPHQKPCQACAGTAVIARGYKRRAKAMSMRSDDFKRDVQPAYNWLLGIIRQLAQRADRAVNKQLGDG